MGPAPPQELSALREWEIQHEQKLEEAREKEDRRQAATEASRIFNQERVEANTNRRSANRADEETAKKTAEAIIRENPWERVADLIDTTALPVGADSQDVSRMR